MRSRHHQERHRLPRSRALGRLAALALTGGAVALSTAGPAAAGVVDPAPIAPHQLFVGQVNGVTVGAVIKVGCFGPVTPGETGHPMAGQTVDVMPDVAVPTPADAGYTGELADHINVGFGNAISAGPVVALRWYAVRVAIPTSLNLPCYGDGKVYFVPAPTSPSARNATVPVSYVSEGATPAP
ncbi:hypothetical protein AB0M29_23425 [Streptomyces sp. NPDC051976]|uniref:hypothetical protein n=1 Tax=Streptomyces sp. NPDC051976 TaxID=3154947 RepID=UPI00342CF21D